MRSKSKTLALGSWSHGTMRNEDVIPALLDACDSVRMNAHDRKTVRRDAAEVNYQTRETGDWYDTEDADELGNRLMDILTCYCPPFCYFGAHEGDGSDYGCWFSSDAYEQSVADGESWIDPGDGSAMPADATYRVRVSDHGNVEVYDRRGRSLVGIV
jgi:hypothetical protein